MTEPAQKTKTITVKGEPVTLTEKSAEYLDALKSVLTDISGVESSVKDILDKFQQFELPFKSEELEMENASIVIYSSTILSNIDKVKTAAKESASWIVKKSK